MSRRKKRNTDCIQECGRRGKYRYGKGLSDYLNISIWAGVYVCDECFKEMEADYADIRSKDQRGAGTIGEGESS